MDNEADPMAAIVVDDEYLPVEVKQRIQRSVAPHR